MDENNRRKIESALPDLVSVIEGKELIPYLVKWGVFSKQMGEDHQDELRSNPRQGLCNVIMRVTKRGPRAYSGFINALVESGHYDAVALLQPKLDVASHAHDLRLKESKSAPNLLGRNRSFSGPPAPPFQMQQMVNILNNISGSEYDAGGFNFPNGNGDQGGMPRHGEMQNGSDEVPVSPRSLIIKPAEIYNGGAVKRCYEMNGVPRGYVLIINNEEFERPELKRRSGSEYDCESLRNIFTQLFFEVEVHRNKGHVDMKRVIMEFAAKEEHLNSNACFVIIMSHGDSDGGRDFVYSFNHMRIEHRWIESQFNNENAPNLHGKPKVLIYQCCRGDTPDSGVASRLSCVSLNRDEDRIETDGTPVMQMGRGLKAPTVSDMLVAHATVPGYASFREPGRGTWFIQTLCEVIAEHAADLHFQELLNETAHRMSVLESSDACKQSPEYTVRGIFQSLYLNPGLPAGPNDDDNMNDLEIMGPI